MFCAVQCFLFVCALTISNAENRVTWNTYESSTPVFQVLFNPSVRFLYVGGRNKLFQLDQDLKLVREIIIGPVRNKLNVEEDNDVKIMLSYKDYLFICGSDGMCHFRPGTNIASRSIPLGLKNDNKSYVTGPGNNVAFFLDPNLADDLYIAKSYDGFGYSISFREIEFTEKMDDEYVKHTLKGLNPHLRYLTSSHIRYIYGFNYDGFGYFLLTQRLTGDIYETRLGRVCNQDLDFFSYSEILLSCRSQTGQAYNLATASYLGQAAWEVKHNLKIVADGKVLYVVFGRNDHGQDPISSFGSVMCMFPMHEIIEEFYNATRSCLNGEQEIKKIKKILGDDYECEKPVNPILRRVQDAYCKKMKIIAGDDHKCEEQEIKTDEDIQKAICHPKGNQYVEVPRKMFVESVASLNEVVVSLFVVIQQKFTVAFLITTNGNIAKYVLEIGLHIGPVYQVPLDSDVESGGRISNAVDPEEENLYLLSGTKVIKFPIGSCFPHPSCTSCIAKSDPLGCGWCGDHCAKKEECSKAPFHEDECPSLVYQVSPLRGHINGGTGVTIRGDFVKPKDEEEREKITVQVAGVDCFVVTWEHQLVECLTGRKGLLSSGTVVVKFKGPSTDFPKDRTMVYSKNFTYVLPKLFGLSPGYGPVSGGTDVTLVGENLDIGSDREVILAGSPCLTFQKSYSLIKCTTSKISSKRLSDTLSGRNKTIILRIDGNKLDLQDDRLRSDLVHLFEYRPDPVIFDVSPKVSTFSGGTILIVTGSHLDSIAHPKLVVSGVHSADKWDIVQECVPGEPLGARLLCRTPSLEEKYVPGSAHVLTSIHFLMDGVTSAKNMSRELVYVEDPYFQAFPDNISRITTDTTEILIKGRNLNLALRPEDIDVSVNHNLRCNVTHLTYDSLRCALPEDLRLVDTVKPLPLAVRAGNLKFEIGTLILEANVLEQSSENLSSVQWSTATITGVAIAATFLLGAIFLTLYKLCPRRIFDSFKKPGTEYGCVFDASAQETAAPDEVNLEKLLDVTHIYDEYKLVLSDYRILFSSDHLTLGEKIGQGQFGRVYKGILEMPREDDGRQVAVKTLHTSLLPDMQTVQLFLQEGLMMKDFHHRNVLSLIGVCFEGTGMPMIILPFMMHGDLKTYIQDEAYDHTIKDLMEFGIQVADGMQYLSKLKFVHRDLAARNCMVDENLTVKVADFGLSRDVYERDYYSSNNEKSKLPVKWMAPESLEQGTYSSKSDVWSFSVLLWELMTRGGNPYPEVSNWEILKYIGTGRRMVQPSFCPDMLFHIMLRCWSEDPHHRPTFTDLAAQIRAVLKKMVDKDKKMVVYRTYVNCTVEHELEM